MSYIAGTFDVFYYAYTGKECAKTPQLVLADDRS